MFGGFYRMISKPRIILVCLKVLVPNNFVWILIICIGLELERCELWMLIFSFQCQNMLILICTYFLKSPICFQLQPWRQGIISKTAYVTYNWRNLMKESEKWWVLKFKKITFLTTLFTIFQGNFAFFSNLAILDAAQEHLFSISLDSLWQAECSLIWLAVT